MSQPNFPKIITHSERIETLLANYREQIGKDFNGYRNHLYRVLNYAMFQLPQDESARALIETALVYHDIGLWTHRELAYLAPSIEIALRDNAEHNWGYDEQLLRDLIDWHHKILPYRGPQQALVNAFRKADWADASKGWIRKGIPRAYIKQVKAAIPEAGFYATLVRLGPELTKNTWQMLKKFSRVMRW